MPNPYFNIDDEVPDFGLGDLNSGLESVFKPATASPEDFNQGVGVPTGGLKSQGLRLTEESIKARESAFGFLQNSMNSNNDIMPSQGIAAALLAAIPTLGGYLIGKSVGKPKIGEGTFFRNLSPEQFGDAFGQGGASGLGQGAAVGQQSAQNYLTGIEKAAAENRILNKDQGLLELKRSDSLSNQATALAREELEQQGIDSRQKNMQDFYREERLGREAFEAANRQPREPSIFDQMSEEQKAAYIAKQSGVDKAGKPLLKNPDFKISLEQQAKLAENYAFITEAENLAKEVSKFDNWADYQKTKIASGLDPEAIQTLFMNVSDRLTRARTGAALNKQEQAIYQKMTQGDISANPKTIANILTKLTASERRANLAKMDVFERASDPTELRTLFQDPETYKRQRLAELRAKRNSDGTNP